MCDLTYKLYMQIKNLTFDFGISLNYIALQEYFYRQGFKMGMDISSVRQGTKLIVSDKQRYATLEFLELTMDVWTSPFRALKSNGFICFEY